MIGVDRINSILNKIMRISSADMTQVSFSSVESGLTRFSGSSIHQNVSEKNVSITVKAIFGKKIGFSSTNQIDDDSINNTLKQAVNAAINSAEDIEFVSLPDSQTTQQCDIFDEQTAYFSPEERADSVSSVIKCAESYNSIASGSFTTGCYESAIMNSNGLFSYKKQSSAGFTAVISSDGGTGYANSISNRVSDIDISDLTQIASKTSVMNKNPQSINPGKYTVILMPYAVAELLEFLSYIGFGALAVQEGRSFMCGNFGKQIMGSNISIWDDGCDPSGLPCAFDSEGVNKQKVELINNGIANTVVYDSYTANKEMRKSTGHASGDTGSYGPLAFNMFMANGENSLDEIISATENGILVNRFHYTNLVHQIQTMITGMTRDGTFLIQNGKISAPLKNLRFTDSILRILSNTDMISHERFRQSWAVVPVIRVNDFNFTGTTEF